MTGQGARDATRRALIAGSLSAALMHPAQAAGLPFADLESRVAGRLGVHALDTATGREISHRAEARFALCSTFKLLLALQIQSRIEAGLERADRSVAFGPSDLVAYSPALDAALGTGTLSIAALVRACLELSDNGAANLLLRTQGGPSGLTAYLRGLGDRVTRLDRIEPDLNTALPGDPRDTTSPRAMTAILKTLVEDRALSASGRREIVTSMKTSRTGLNRLRKDLPSGWTAADKTGTGQRGSTNDVAILWPPGARPILVSAYLTEADAPLDQREAVLAEVGRRVVQTLSRGQA